ncbi:MAG: extracellular solute-binding protein, partial [Anaerolineaceae bacterium]|nr:extracellular solute-binding protein [Anaerolineaceae bacterium]
MKKQISRRDFLKIAGIAGGASVLAACAPAATQQPAGNAAESPTTAPKAAEPVTITFTGWGGTEEDEGVKAAVAAYEEQNPGMKVTWIQIPENYDDKTLAMVAAGTPPDTAFVNNNKFQQYAKDGLLMDITNQLKSDAVLGAKDYFIQPQEEQRCTRDGKWFGIGSCWVAPHIYYNADIFEKEGIEPPSNDPAKTWTWDSFLKVADQLTLDTSGKHPSDSGFDKDNIERWAIQWPTWSIPLHAAIASNGGHWLNQSTGLIELDKPEATEALQRVADLMLVQNVSPRGTAFAALGLTNTQMLENGKLAMAVDGSWALSWITKIKANLGTAVLPMIKQPATDMQAHIHSPFAKSKNPDAAWPWIRFLSTEFYQLIFLKIGLWLPSQTALMTPEGMSKWYTERTAPGQGVHPKGYDMIVKDYVPKYGHVLYMPPGYTEADSIITPALDAIWIGDKTAEQAMKEAVPVANKKL